MLRSLTTRAYCEKWSVYPLRSACGEVSTGGDAGSRETQKLLFLVSSMTAVDEPEGAAGVDLCASAAEGNVVLASSATEVSTLSVGLRRGLKTSRWSMAAEA